MEQKLNRQDPAELWKSILEIVERGDTAEVRKSREGLKVYAVSKRLRCGRPSNWDRENERKK